MSKAEPAIIDGAIAISWVVLAIVACSIDLLGRDTRAEPGSASITKEERAVAPLVDDEDVPMHETAPKRPQPPANAHRRRQTGELRLAEARIEALARDAWARPRIDAPSFDTSAIAAAAVQLRNADDVERESGHANAPATLAPSLDVSAKDDPSLGPGRPDDARRDVLETWAHRERAREIDGDEGSGALGGGSRTNQMERPLNKCCVRAETGKIGCADVACSVSICKERPSCCTRHWDSRCAEAAIATCHVCEGAPPESSFEIDSR